VRNLFFTTIILLMVSAARAGDPPAPATPAPVATAPSADSGPVYRLRLYHTHTDERIDVVYRRGNTYDPEALEQLDYFLRDSRNGTVHPYDPRLFDLLNELAASVGHPDGEIDVVCGYRTPETNRALRRRSRRVAKHSLHMEAMAIDIRIPGVPTKELRNAALQLHEGGVGYYRRHAFVHVDVGRVRKW
jgi:uncharacterized protein YcbK (DUF882 family)